MAAAAVGRCGRRQSCCGTSAARRCPLTSCILALPLPCPGSTHPSFPTRIGVNWSFPLLYTPALLPFIATACATLAAFRGSIPADKSWGDPFAAATAKCRGERREPASWMIPLRRFLLPPAYRVAGHDAACTAIQLLRPSCRYACRRGARHHWGSDSGGPHGPGGAAGGHGLGLRECLQ